ncbi:MAG: M48 family metallopeptidase [Hyphomicrobiales bacterium]
MQTSASYFDGEIAAERAVSVTMTGDGINLEGPGFAPQSWDFSSLVAIEPPYPGRPFRLTRTAQPGVRLVIHDDAFAAELASRAPHLKGGVNPRRLARNAAWIAAGFAVLAILGYLTLQLVPQKIAFLLPDSWGERMGAKIETELTAGTRPCTNGDGEAALAALAARLGEGTADMPKVSIRAYDIPVMNAFAMPGGRIVVTGELIARADAPEELAGVIGHEIGHVYHRHSEAQMVRAAGVQILVSIATGGGGDSISSLAGLAAIMRYSRAAEAEADDYGLALLAAAQVDPMGFKRFFEKVLQEEGERPGGAVGKIQSVFATHPGTAERMKRIGPLPDGVTARPVLSDAEWRALRRVCG